jgi:hypothetical protein
LNSNGNGNKFGWKDFEDAHEEYLAVRRKLLKRKIVPYLHQLNRVNEELNELAGKRVYENLNPMLAASELIDWVFRPEKNYLDPDEDVWKIED